MNEKPKKEGIKGGDWLRKSLRRAERRKVVGAVSLIMPLLVLMIVFYFIPIAMMLYRSIDNSQMRDIMPHTAIALKEWNGEGLPQEKAFAAVAKDLKAAREKRIIAKVGRRLNFDKVGFYSLVSKTGRNLKNITGPPWKEALIKIDDKWQDTAYWTVLERGLKDITLIYMLSALDMRLDDANKIVGVVEEESIYISIITRTIYISTAVTLLCLLLGFPIAYFLATAKPRVRNLLMIVLLLVFWTSLLVRTLSWILVLQNHGVVNSALLASGLISEPLELVFNRIGVYIAMTHVLLPFMVLPLYSVMRGIPPTYLRAAHSLGAKPFTAFRRVYIPQTLPGIGAGALMVFIQALGYYITPALVGGPKDQMVSYFVAFFVNERVNWSMASALGVVLLVLTSSMYLLFGRKVNIANMKMG
jgi:putative spermidine/putrescine transport system permease protein